MRDRFELLESRFCGTDPGMERRSRIENRSMVVRVEINLGYRLYREKN